MEPSGIHYLPLTLPFYAALGVVFALLLALIQLHVLAYAYERMGIQSRYILGFLLLSLLGASINVPVAQLPHEDTVKPAVVSYFGVQYVVPVVRHWPGTVIAVNIGGAVIPVLLSVYLLAKKRLFFHAAIGVFVVAIAVHAMAYPVRGVGIATPSLAPPLIAATVAVILSWTNAPALAYICGSLGTLIGADLMNLSQIQGLGAPIASIGGAGTFDGVFLTGILAVLLTGGWRIQQGPGQPESNSSA